MGLYRFPGHARVRGNETADISQGAAPLRSLLDLSRLLRSLGRISVISLKAGWITSVWQYGVVHVILRDRLGNWFLALAQLQCPITVLQWDTIQGRHWPSYRT
jgi:hypothetical protein